MKCKGCVANGEYGCRAGFTSIIINGEFGCEDADRALDAFHFNQAKDKTVAGITVYPSRKDHKRRPISRADNLRAMTDEELAELIAQYGGCPPERYPDGYDCESDCNECWLEWLREDVSK